MQRRRFLSALAAGAAALSAPTIPAKSPESDELEQYDLRLDGDPKLARRALLFVPKHVVKSSRLPLLVLLHGLGETGNELSGIHAWGDLYGLVRAYERLRRPPVRPTLEQQRYLLPERAAEINALVKERPFGGLVLVCPVTPNPYKPGPASRTLDRYADWIQKSLLPAAREAAKKSSAAIGIERIGLDGCSLGGYVGIEVFLRKPELFATIGGVQSAFSVPAALGYAKEIARALKRVGPRAIHVETSSLDPYRKSNDALARRLRELGVEVELRVPPGPHDQPWLREIGTLEMLLYQDRKLRQAKIETG